MPVYGTPQSGPYADSGRNLRAISPGDRYVLFNGTETPAADLASVAIVRGHSPSAADNGVTFYVSGSAETSTVIDIQGSNEDVDGSYFTVAQITPDANGNGSYTDVGRDAFYRAKLSAYSTGAMPVVTAQR